MPLNELWYHDENEVDERHSWLSNSPWLINNTVRKSYDNCSYSKVLALVEYARPDFILTVDGEPLISVEVTARLKWESLLYSIILSIREGVHLTQILVF